MILVMLLISSIPLLLGQNSDDVGAAPAFLSSPLLTADVDQEYDYEIIPNNYSATILVYWTDASWPSFYLTSWHLIGFPNATDIGLANISLRLNESGVYAFQNFTVVVQPKDYDAIYLDVGLGLIFCFGLLLIGFKRNEFLILAGPVWIVVALTVFLDFGDTFMMTGVGIGIVSLFTGVLRYGK